MRAALLALLLLAPAAAGATTCNFNASPEEVAACQQANLRQPSRAPIEAAMAERAAAAAQAEKARRAALVPWILAGGALGLLGGVAYGFRRRRPVLGGERRPK